MSTKSPSISQGNKPSNTPIVSKTIPRSVFWSSIPLELKTGVKGTKDHYAYIEVTIHRIIWDRDYYTFRWVGETWKPVRFDTLFLTRVGLSRIEQLPWKLRRLPARDWYDDFNPVFVRSDGGLMPLALLNDFGIRLSKLWTWFAVRLIVTAMVWGLAYVPSGDRPSWRHIGKRGE